MLSVMPSVMSVADSERAIRRRRFRIGGIGKKLSISRLRQ